MNVNKRDFLKASGLTLAGFTLLAPGEALSQHEGGEAASGVKRLAMIIDPIKCPGDCKECVTACNRAHNIPDIKDDKRHEIKWIWQEPYLNTFAVPEHEEKYISEKYVHSKIPVLCNHCDNPSCVRVCPTKATFKHEATGIVMMDYHRCIGCRYCMAACPFGSRSFNYVDPRKYLSGKPTSDYPTRTKGVVEKCDFCVERLGKGIKPACVEACPQGAMIFGDINEKMSEAAIALRENFTLRRKPELGTLPMVYYIVRG